MKYNKKRANKSKPAYNFAGEPAYKLSPEYQLASIALTSFTEDTYYESWDKRTERIRYLLGQVSPNFIAKLAVFSRKEMGLRTIPFILLITAINEGLHKTHKELFRDAIRESIKRADELSNILAIYKAFNKNKVKPLSNTLKRGVAEAFLKFNEYHFSKYKKIKHDISLKDALILTHPKPKDEKQSELFKKILDDNLEIPYTWEVKLSEIPKDDIEGRREFWKDIITTGKLGYMAAIRNIRNMLKVADDELIDILCEYITKKELIKKSSIFPYRILSAYKAIYKGHDYDFEIFDKNTPNKHSVIESINENYLNKVRKALEKAIKISIIDVMLEQSFWTKDEKILIASDVSGSMRGKISSRSFITLKDIAVLYGLGVASAKKDSTFGIFADEWAVLSEDKKLKYENILDGYYKVSEINVGGATNGHLALKWAAKNNREFDKIIFFTDCELWDSEGDGVKDTFYRYRKAFPNTKLYIFDLAGYGDTFTKIEEKGVYFVAGYSDKIFEIVELLEQGKNLVNQIKDYDIYN